MNTNKLTAQLREPGIRQECEPFDLASDRAQARALWDELRCYVKRLQEIYPFTKGIGIAAPQIGIARAMSVVKPQDEEPFSSHQPVVLWRSDEKDEKYEGLLPVR
jgi:peptide deformylase